MSDALNDRARIENGLAARRLGTRLGSTEGTEDPDGRVPDQVPRMLAYGQAHPDVVFHPPRRADPMWTAVLNGGDVEVRAFNLGPLMDELERRDRLPA